MKDHTMDIFPDPTHPILGFLGAGISGASIWLAQVAGPMEGWVQLGGTIGLVGCLSYACKTLWTELQRSRQETAELNSQMRADWKQQNDKLINVLERLDSDKP